MNKLKIITDKLPEFFRKFIKKERDQSQLYKYQSHDISELYQKVHSGSNPVFVLSPGRSGTKYLTRILEQFDKVDVVHVGSPEFTYYHNYAYQNQSEMNVLSPIVDAARYEQLRNSYILERTYIETNNRITFFARALKNLYPQARFIELKRDPIKFVESGYSRNWYSDTSIRDEGRIRLLDNDDWDKMSQVEKIAFQWKETHDFIASFFGELNKKDFLTVHSEELFSDRQVLDRVVKFILPDCDPGKIAVPGIVNSQSKRKELSTDQIEEVNSYLKG